MNQVLEAAGLRSSPKTATHGVQTFKPEDAAPKTTAPSITSDVTTIQIGALTMSRPFSKIATALYEAQAKIGPASKGVENAIHNSKYADLSSVLNACRAPLHSAGILLMQPAKVENGQVTVTTILMKDDEWMASDYSISTMGATAWDVGSATTYAKRYGLQSLLAVATEDDDGNAASRTQSGHRPEQPQWAPQQRHQASEQRQVSSIHGSAGDTNLRTANGATAEWVEATATKSIPSLRLPVTLNNPEGRAYALDMLNLVLSGQQEELAKEFELGGSHKRQFLVAAHLHHQHEGALREKFDAMRAHLSEQISEEAQPTANKVEKSPEEQWDEIRSMADGVAGVLEHEMIVNDSDVSVLNMILNSHVNDNHKEVHRIFLECDQRARDLIKVAISSKKSNPDTFGIFVSEIST